MSALTRPVQAALRRTGASWTCTSCLLTHSVRAPLHNRQLPLVQTRQFSDPRHNRRMKKLAKAERSQISMPTSFDVNTTMRLVRAMAIANFDETVEVAVNLGVDPRKPGQMVRSVVSLPHSFQEVTVAVFAKDAKAEEAKEAGADIVGGMDLVERIQAGDISFDRCIATPDMMPIVGRVARILGPRGLMPNPKVGTVSMDVATAVRDAKGGQIAFRTEKAGVVHAPIGKASFSEKQLEDNLFAFVKALVSLQPATMKGTYMRKIVVSSTMGKGVPVDLKSLPFKLEKSEF